MSSSQVAALVSGALTVSVGPARLIEPDANGRCIQLSARDGDMPQILLWETDAHTRRLYDYLAPDEPIRGLTDKRWLPGLESQTWKAVDHYLANHSIASPRFDGGASSQNTPEVAGKWAIEILAELEGDWSPDLVVTHDSLQEAVARWRLSQQSE